MIAFFGAPGSGKSLQGQLLAARHDWRWLSTGQILRDSRDPDTLTKIKSGQLLSNDIMFPLVRSAIKAAGDINRLVLDGFPRTEEQVRWLLDEENELGRQLDLVICVDVSDEELDRRLNLRGRADDTADERKHRQSVFQQQLEPVIRMFEERNITVKTVNGQGTVGEVHDRIEEILESCTLV